MATKKLSRSKSARKASAMKKPATKRPKRPARAQRAPKPKRAPRPAAAIEAGVRREQRALVRENERMLREAGLAGGRGSRSKGGPGGARPGTGKRRAKRQLH